MVKNKLTPKISVVLNAYKRTDYLALQLDAIENQTIKPHEIFVWQNAGGEIDKNLMHRFIIARCSENLGVWARFAFALNVRADYICIFDDDTIPGNRWFENCLNTLKEYDGLLGTRGLRYHSTKRYHPFEHYGWGNPNDETVQVDIVGHAWFFRREYLSFFWSEMPPIESNYIAGEDIHFSYMLQKFGIGTYVPPHPKNDKNLWGSLPEHGLKIGTDNNAISSSQTALSRFDNALRYYTKNGFKLFRETNHEEKRVLVVGSGLRGNKKIRALVNKNKVLKNFGKWLLKKIEKLGIYF